MKTPKISVVTPSFNCGKYIEETILSVLSQDYPNFEYFVIDGGSTDNTLEILKNYSKKYPAKFNYISEPDKGQTDAINKGLGMCSGDWFAWLNADDFYEPHVFKKLAAFFKKYKNAGVVYGNCYDVSEEGRKIKLSIPKKYVDRKVLLGGHNIYGPASFFNMRAFEKVGFFDTSLYHWMDYDMFIRISKVMELKYVDLNITNFRIRKGQKSPFGEINTKAGRYFKKEVHHVIVKNGGPYFSRHLLNRFVLFDYLMSNSLMNKISRSLKRLK